LSEVKSLFQLQDAKTWLLDRGLEWLDTEQGRIEVREQRTALDANSPDRPRV